MENDQNDNDFDDRKEKADDRFSRMCADGMEFLDDKKPVMAGVGFMLAIEEYLGEFHVPPAALQLALRVPLVVAADEDREDAQFNATLDADFIISMAESATFSQVKEKTQQMAIEAADGLLSRIESVMALWLNYEDMGNVPDAKTRRNILITARFAMVLTSSIRVWGHAFGHQSKGVLNPKSSMSQPLDFWETVVSDGPLAKTMKASALLRNMYKAVMTGEEPDYDLDPDVGTDVDFDIDLDIEGDD